MQISVSASVLQTTAHGKADSKVGTEKLYFQYFIRQSLIRLLQGMKLKVSVMQQDWEVKFF